MTSEVRQWFLDYHNDYRNLVALGLMELGEEVGESFIMQAADMHILEYDEELEYLARCWVNECIIGHDSCRATERWQNVGQNYFSYTHSKDQGVPTGLSEENVEYSVGTW